MKNEREATALTLRHTWLSQANKVNYDDPIVKLFAMKRIKTLYVLAGTFCMNLIILAILFGPVWSCMDFTDEYHYYVDPRLKVFVDRFYGEARKRGINLPMNGLSVALQVPSGNDGAFGESLNGTFVVFLLPSFVYNQLRTGYRADSLWVEDVVFHELGHSLLFENHRGGESIMNPAGQHMNLYATDESARQKMINELFAHYE